jgi:hypothetical protein
VRDCLWGAKSMKNLASILSIVMWLTAGNAQGSNTP